MKSLVVTLGGSAVLLVLVLIATLGGPLPAMVAIGAATFLLLLVTLGPERLGILTMLIATVLAACGIDLAGARLGVGYADVAYLVGITLLVPRLLRTRTTVPKVWLAGSLVMVTHVLISSLLLPTPAQSLLLFGKFLGAAIILPIAYNRLRPSYSLLNAFAWSFVLGHVISAVVAISRGQTFLGGGRGVGLGTHPNYYGLAGMLSLGLLIFLGHRTPRRYLWVVWLAAIIAFQSIVSSGSRAALIGAVITLIAWALIERTAISSFLLIAGVAVTAAGLNFLLSVAPPTSALGRLAGQDSAQGSNLEREAAFRLGLAKFKAHPIIGNGFEDFLASHNVYLQVAAAGGVIAAVAFVLMLIGLIQPLFRMPTNWLSLMALAYFFFGVISNTIYDRILWAALALILAVQLPPDPSLKDPEKPTVELKAA